MKQEFYLYEFGIIPLSNDKNSILQTMSLLIYFKYAKKVVLHLTIAGITP